jgi:hypothetical protein
MDSEAYGFIVKAALPHLVPIEVSNLCTPEVAEVRERTTHGQFCWVCQPLICSYILDVYKVDMVTYLEADSLFFNNPEPLYDELNDYSVSLVSHRFPPHNDQSSVSGKYCVQFNAFKNDDVSRKVLEYWKSCCLRYTRDKLTCYPGQTALDDWPERFSGVVEISHLGAGIAPWNVMQYELTRHNATVEVNGQPAIFYHYHQYLRYKNGSHELGNYKLSDSVIEYFYKPYILLLADVQQWACSIDPLFVYRREAESPKTLIQAMSSLCINDVKEWLYHAKRKYMGTYNVYPAQHFSE